MAFANSGGEIFQGVGSILAPNTQFTFGVQAGLRDDVGASSTFKLTIQAGGLALVSQEYTISSPGFEQFYLVYNNAVDYGSESLVIKMSYVSGGQINFDDVTLSYTSLPEPGTLSLLGVGLLVGGFAGFKKKIPIGL